MWAGSGMEVKPVRERSYSLDGQVDQDQMEMIPIQGQGQGQDQGSTNTTKVRYGTYLISTRPPPAARLASQGQSAKTGMWPLQQRRSCHATKQCSNFEFLPPSRFTLLYCDCDTSCLGVPLHTLALA